MGRGRWHADVLAVWTLPLLRAEREAGPAGLNFLCEEQDDPAVRLWGLSVSGKASDSCQMCPGLYPCPWEEHDKDRILPPGILLSYTPSIHGGPNTPPRQQLELRNRARSATSQPSLSAANYTICVFIAHEITGHLTIKGILDFITYSSYEMLFSHSVVSNSLQPHGL